MTLTESEFRLLERKSLFADQQKKIQDDVYATIIRNNWLNMHLPVEVGGLQLNLPDAVQLIEDIASADGSAGWFVTLVSGAHWFYGFVNKAIHPLFTNKDTVVAGSGASTGVAEWNGKSYTVNGNWLYATGCQKATLLTANCVLHQNGQPMLKNGAPVIRSFIFLRKEVQLHFTWYAMGMKATGSHSFSVANVAIPKNRSFEILPEQATSEDPVFQLPFYPFAQCTLLPNITGMVRHFYQLLTAETNTDYADEGYQQFQSARLTFFDEVQRFSQTHMHKNEWNSHALDVAFNQTVHAAIHCMQQLYMRAGMHAAQENTILNLIWRDFNTAIQHSIFRRNLSPSI